MSLLDEHANDEGKNEGDIMWCKRCPNCGRLLDECNGNCIFVQLPMINDDPVIELK